MPNCVISPLQEPLPKSVMSKPAVITPRLNGYPDSNPPALGLLNNPVSGAGGMEIHAAADWKPAQLARPRWTRRGSSRAAQALQRASRLAARAAESRLRLIAAAVR